MSETDTALICVLFAFVVVAILAGDAIAEWVKHWRP